MNVWGLAALAVLLSGSVAAQDVTALRVAMLHTGDERVLSDRALSPSPSYPLTPSDTTLVDPWLGRDKVLHAAGSFLLTLSAQYVLTAKLNAAEGTALPIAAGTTLSLGLAKEVADSQRPVRPLFSTRDLVADAVGVALAVGLILL